MLAENRLTTVSGATSASFTYDGDGNRVKSVLNGVTTGNVGNPLCQSLAGSPRGGNDFVLTGAVAVTAPSWRGNCEAVSSVTAMANFARAGVISGSISNLAYDAENRLTTVSGATSASFVYDGDGNRVKSIMGGVTTYYVGAHFEWTGSTTSMVKYYYAGGQRVAMRKGNPGTVYFLLGDHLGSTSITANSNGTLYAEQRYHPWGGTRWPVNPTTPTSYQYTGQHNDSSIGLYFYNARYYDPYLNRFISPDSIVPSPENPQSLNRYSYTLNNPLRYNDPSGHCSGDPNDPDNPDAGCWAMINQIQGTYGNIFILDQDTWTEDELRAVWDALLAHVFIKDILNAPVIKFFRQNFYARQNDKIGGYTLQVNDIYNVWIYDEAYKFLPDCSGLGEPSLRNFESVVIHELAHVAMRENPFIIESYALRSNWVYYPERLLPLTFGEAYPRKKGLPKKWLR